MHIHLPSVLCGLPLLVKVIRVLQSVFPGVRHIEGSDRQRRVAARGIRGVCSACCHVKISSPLLILVTAALISQRNSAMHFMSSTSQNNEGFVNLSCSCFKQWWRKIWSNQTHLRAYKHKSDTREVSLQGRCAQRLGAFFLFLSLSQISFC